MPVVLRKLAKAADDARNARRILEFANALDGMSRDEAARSAGLDRQTPRDRVLRYNSGHGIEGLGDRWNGGRRPTFTAQEQTEMVKIALAGPDPEATGLSTLTLEDLAGIGEARFGKRMHPWSLGRRLKSPGLSRQEARPVHPETDPAAQAAFKKSPGDPATGPHAHKKALAAGFPGRGAHRADGPHGARLVATRGRGRGRRQRPERGAQRRCTAFPAPATGTA